MKPGASRDAPHGAPLMRRSGASQPWHAHHSGGGGGAPHLPMSWVLCLCAVTYLLGHYSPRPDLQALPRSPQAAGDAPAVSHGPRDSQASAAAVRVEPLEVLPQRQGYLDGQAPSDDLTLDSMLWQQARAAPTASQQAAAGSDAADAALAAAQAVQLPHSRKLIASPAAARAPGGAAAYAPAPGRGQLGSVEAAAARFLSDTGIARLRPPAAPGDGGEAGYRVIPFQVLSWYPRIVLLPAFLDEARCDHIIGLTERKLEKSGLAFRPTEEVDPNQQTRTSWGTFVTRQEDPAGALAYLEDKIAAVTMLPVSHGEAFNVLRYTAGGHYDSHMDTFDPKDFGPQPSQRMVTVVTYLSDVEEGGETVFKREGFEGAGKPIDDWRSCEPGAFKVKPRKGDAVLFYSLTPDLKIDDRSLHGACPVGASSTKWAAVKWIHEIPFGPDPTRPRRGGAHPYQRT